MTIADYDIVVIGGGINGAGIARDAAGRGLKVLLCEAQDLASATSSASTKLIHGGLRYLEHFEFKLVRESLEEREVLLKSAPHIIWPLDFIMPHENSVRPAWMIRLGLFLYDHLGGREILKGSRGINFKRDGYGVPLKPLIRRGFSYQDCWVEDSRLVALNAMDAVMQGADVLTYAACSHIAPSKQKKGWKLRLQDTITKREVDVSARAIINAAGPWVRTVLESSKLIDEDNPAPKVRLVKGSHIITKRLFEGDHAYILQQPDKRIVFAIPYEHDYTLIGTTDEEYHGNPSQAMCDEDEIQYLCDAINVYFKDAISHKDVLWSYSGVRPLIDDGETNVSKVTRDYKFHMDHSFGAPILSVFGGKLTTYRTLAEHAVDDMCAVLKCKKGVWTKNASLPGGKIKVEEMPRFVETQVEYYSWLPEGLVRRFARAYGTRMDIILGHATSVDQLGKHYGDHIYESELIYSIHYELARTAEDFLWRRTKLGLHINQDTIDKLEAEFPALYEKVKQR